jgi:hypothetical protein
MRIHALAFAALFATLPAAAEEAALRIELIPGHPVYHESEGEAGVTMALSVTPSDDRATRLTTLCEELRAAAGLKPENDDQLRLETIFVVPYKGMAVEGYYWPKDGTVASGTLVAGDVIPRGTLDDIVGQAGIPPRILDEIDAEHEISCETDEPLWHIAWSDVRHIGDEDPDAVIERAYRRFLALHRSVLEHNGQEQHVVGAVQRTGMGG